MKLKNWEVSVALVSVILGMLLAVQFQTQQSITEAVPTRRVEELVTMLKEAKAAKLASEQRINQLKNQLEGNQPEERANISAKLNQVRLWAGMDPMSGPGIIVTLNDNGEQSNLVSNNNLNVVQDEDLLRTVNELKAAGAEAISLNGQRIVATSEIRWAGSHILVNNTSISSPYEIKVIGNTERLESALKLKNGIVDTLSVWGIQIKISHQNVVSVPAYRGNLDYKSVKIIPDGQ